MVSHLFISKVSLNDCLKTEVTLMMRMFIFQVLLAVLENHSQREMIPHELHGPLSHSRCDFHCLRLKSVSIQP